MWDAFTVHYYVEQITLPAELLMSASMDVGTVQKKGGWRGEIYR